MIAAVSPAHIIHTHTRHPHPTHYRLSSNIVPWMSAVGDIQRLKDYDAIAYNLKLAGDMVCVGGWGVM